ncbi:MAG: tRNA (guanosine(46)-N7)-methyltransferase TrmB [Oscillospiraceae bacterium]
MRRKPWARPELDACAFYVKDPPSLLGHWKSAFARPELPMQLELGCGKGGFIAPVAASTPDVNFLAVDIKSEVLALTKRALDKEFADASRSVDNALIAAFDIERIHLVLGADDIFERIYINFPNPWPKDRHKKKRLTHPRALAHYRDFLSDDARLFIKTDDDELYTDTLGYLSESGFEIVTSSFDLYSECAPTLPLTEHEQMFISRGLPIHYIEAAKRPLPLLSAPAAPYTPCPTCG